jgi:hypothetical protein
VANPDYAHADTQYSVEGLYESAGGGRAVYRVYVTNNGQASLVCFAEASALTWSSQPPPLQVKTTQKRTGLVGAGKRVAVLGITGAVAEGEHSVRCEQPDKDSVFSK